MSGGFAHIGSISLLMLSVFCVLSSSPTGLNVLCLWLCNLGHLFFHDRVDGLVCSVLQRQSKVREADNTKVSPPVWMAVWL